MQDWGYEVFATLLLPGAVIALSGWLVVSELDGDGPLTTWLTQNAGEEWKFSIVLLVASTLFGHILASFGGAIESGVLDRITRKRLKIDAVRFTKNWDDYVDWLSHGKNSYVSRTARLFWFNFRMGLALLILGVTLGWWPHASWWMTALALAVGATLLVQAARTHYILAEWRSRYFEDGVPPASG